METQMSPGRKSAVWTGLTNIHSLTLIAASVAPFNKFPSHRTPSVIGMGAPAIKSPQKTISYARRVFGFSADVF